MKYFHEENDERDVIVETPLKIGRRARRTQKRKEAELDDRTWCPMLEPSDDDKMELDYAWGGTRRNLLSAFELDMKIRKATVEILYHHNDIPLPIVDNIISKAKL